MRKSIKWRYTAIIVGIMAAVFVIMYFFIAFGLESFESLNKRKSMLGCINIIEQNISNGWDNDNALKLTREASANNLGIAVYYVTDALYQRQIFATNSNLDSVMSRFESFLRGGTISADNIYENTDTYVLYDIFDERMEGVQIECLGVNGSYYYVITTSLAGIEESVRILSMFFLITSIIGLLIAAVAVFFATGKITGPITKLAKQSEKISKLDFGDHYTGKDKNEIGVLGANMNLMSEKLEATIKQLECDVEEKERINKAQREFLGNASHELKTPIAVIQGYAEGLRDGIADDNESRDFYSSVIVDEAVHMNTIVRRLLNLDEIESGRMKISVEQFDIVKVIRGILETAKPFTDGQNVSVTLRAPQELSVTTDEFMVEQVITNYFSNACHHVSNPGTITISSWQENEEIFVSVENTGKQIPEEDLDRIWEKFYKVDKAHTRTYGGSGIGLSIVKTIIEQLGGSCGVNNLETGVNFWFKIPGKRN